MRLNSPWSIIMPFIKSTGSTIADKLLVKNLSTIWIRLNAVYLNELSTGFRMWLKKETTKTFGEGISLVDYLLHQIDNHSETINSLKHRLTEFNQFYFHATDEEERRDYLLKFSRDLGASRKQLSEDKKAFQRWFDRDALLDRHQGILAKEYKKLTLTLERLSYVYSTIMLEHKEPVKFWKSHPLEKMLSKLFVFQENQRVKVAAFRCLAEAISGIPYAERETLISDSSLQYIYRSSLEKNQDISIQKSALSLLADLSPQSLQRTLTHRITKPSAGDDLFVRRHAVFLVGKYLTYIPELEALLVIASNDTKPSVRQVVASALKDCTIETAMPILYQLAIKDSDQTVRGATIWALSSLLQNEIFFTRGIELLQKCCEQEKNIFVLKIQLKLMVSLLPSFTPDQRARWINSLGSCLDVLQYQCERVEIRRKAAQAKEWFWIFHCETTLSLYKALLSQSVNLKEGKYHKISKELIYENELQLARVLSLLAQNGHGFTLEKRYGQKVIYKGDRFRFRFWRFLYELKHSSTDKRQAHSHTQGRHFDGLIRSPSSIMCELSQTKVPGEPLYISQEGGWRPFLPLVDDILSALDQSWPTKKYHIVSSEGITEIVPPNSLWKRLKAQWTINKNFELFAKRRNWTESSSHSAHDYISSIQSLGFSIRFHPHSDLEGTSAQSDSSLSRFFPGFLPLNWADFTERAKDYFFSVYENTLFHLGIFVLIISGYFFGRHIYLNRMMRRARQSIPLVIGGWGTRGKSGTERLKAALFNALGYSVVSKTTGCEAMFLHAPVYGKLQEMFLFRPYDKASIWEQVDVVRIAQKLDCEVFLWECMGLTPSYVQVLQNDWMHDDIATITNTYPDHEDIQGPAGHEIPRVMTNFIPKNSTLLTTEEQMCPILEQAAKEQNTDFISVGWLEAGLLSSDLLERFPYQEHPYNIALVLKLAETLGIGKDFAVKAMADNVVTDLGVLKTYPVAQVENRQLEFVMGMSANERYGAMGNWIRMKFDQHALSKDPQIWLCTVVNNRADRVPRSRVFASILAEDIAADKHFLIGNNLHGLKNYIDESWQQNLSQFNLFDSIYNETPVERLRNLATRLRVPKDQNEARGRIGAILQGLNLESLKELWDKPQVLIEELLVQHPDTRLSLDDLTKFIEEILTTHNEYLAFEHRLLSACESNQPLSQQTCHEFQLTFNNLATAWFENKIILVEDYYATGEQVIKTIVKNTPMGLHARIMGMQNIKGTGLDFVYRWQAWESCSKACSQALDPRVEIAKAGVKMLSQFKEYGVLSEDKILQTISTIKYQTWTQKEEIQAELALISFNLKQAMAEINQQQGQNKNSGWSHKMAEYLEAFMDAGDAVKRRKKANQIYIDLQNTRISHERASLELQLLNKRQKGGWAGDFINKLT